MSNMSSSMENFLDDLLAKAENKEALVMIQFRTMGAPVQGALRHAEIKGIFELLATAQSGPNGKPFLLSNFFAADAVASVMIIKGEVPKAEAPNGGLFIPH